ncbi:MAG: DUF6597 domain-containing transcriptional factor [Cytophagales bacterium]|nr:DUF6597 domain-containing transcriptional factor [Cytophagales bacterium]
MLFHYMIYHQEQPHDRLKELVRCLWRLENRGPEVIQHTILPDGFFDLLVSYQNQELKEIALSGLWTHRAQVMIMPGTVIFGVQFRPLSVEVLIQKQIASLLNDIDLIDQDFWGLDKFDERAQPFSSFMNNRLLTIVAKAKAIDSRKKHLLTLVDQTKGTQSVDQYSEVVCWTKRQINRYFQTTFGISLKTYCTIRKGAASFGQIKRGKLYPEQPYFDQSHFIKSIRKISGVTPSELTKNENDRFLQLSIIKEK